MAGTLELIEWELKKLFKSKLTVACVLLCVIFIFIVFMNEVIDHSYYIFDSSVYPPAYSERVFGAEFRKAVRAVDEPFIGRRVDESFVGDVLSMYGINADVVYAQTMALIRSPLYGFIRFGVSSEGKLTALPASEWLAYSDDAPTYGFTMGWQEAFKYLNALGYVLILVCVALTASVFSNEYACGSDALLLTSKYGKNRCAAAKILTVTAFCLLLTLSMCALLIISVNAFYGFEGADTDIRVMSGLSFTDYGGDKLTCLGLCVTASAIICCASLIAAGITVFISSVCPSVFTAVAAGLGLTALPALINAVLPEAVKTPVYLKLFALFPVGALNASAGRWYTFDYGGLPYTMILPALMLILCAVTAVGAYTAFGKHRVG